MTPRVRRTLTRAQQASEQAVREAATPRASAVPPCPACGSATFLDPQAGVGEECRPAVVRFCRLRVVQGGDAVTRQHAIDIVAAALAAAANAADDVRGELAAHDDIARKAHVRRAEELAIALVAAVEAAQAALQALESHIEAHARRQERS